MRRSTAGRGSFCFNAPPAARGGARRRSRFAPGSVYTFRDGKIARYEVYPEHSAALEAVGLRE